MDHASYTVIYVDRRAKDQSAKRSSLLPADQLANGTHENHPDVQSAVDALLSVFNRVQVCSSGSSCLDRISDLDNAIKAPVLVLVDIPPQDARQTWTGHDRQKQADSTEPGDIYGIKLLAHLGTDIRAKKLSKVIVPIAVIDLPETSQAVDLPERPQTGLGDARFMRLVDAGAVDVLMRPLSGDQMRSLAILGYRMLRDFTKSNSSFLASKCQRKMSWVGVEPEKPYSYLREAMVSNLMSGICSPEPDPQFDIWNAMRSARLNHDDEDDRPGERDSISGIGQTWLRKLSDERKAIVAEAIGYWSFSAHDFSDDELLYAALLMLEHTLQMPELAPWHASTDDLVVYLHACRSSYNDFVHYHNFRHVVDVLQAVFHFLVQLRTIPPYPQHDTHSSSEECMLASILEPFDALTLLVSAVGHDVGHPGVNNAFLVSLNAPLAQLFNDRSVLESFHCASYSQVLRRHWPAVFRDTKMRRLMINSILATDMGVHFKYMEDLDALQRILKSDSKVVERWGPKEKEKYRDLVCALLIKCADISNIARVFPVAHKWADILNEEFAHQGEMERDLGIKSCLAGDPPIIGDDIQLGKSQQGFMKTFALPLFQEVSGVLPDMKYSVVELERNRAAWEKCVAELSMHSDCCTSARCEKLLGVGSLQSDVQSPRSLGEASSPAATQTSTVCSSTNGAAAFSPSPITPTSPSVQVDDVLQKVPTNEAPARGRLQKMNGSSQPIALHVPTRANKSKSQRASSAHQTRRRHDVDAADPVPNGILNQPFASDTDLQRYLGNSESVPSNPDEKGDAAMKNKGLERRLTQSFKRLWKKRWRPGDKKLGVQVEAK